MSRMVKNSGPRPDYPTHEGRLVVGGVTLDRLAQRVGDTPFFAYDRARLTQRVASLRSALSDDIELSYALKANPMPALVHHLAGLVDSLDVASGAEMQIALNTPVAPQAISFAGPGKSMAELTQAVAAGVLLEVESETEGARVIETGELLGVQPRVAVRVNPDFEVKGSGMRMGGGAQQFGVDAENAADLLKQLAAGDVEVVGLHVFAGSQNLHAEILEEAQGRTVDLMLRLAEAASQEFTYFNMGGGFGIPYYQTDSALDLDAIGSNVQSLVKERLRPSYPDARIVIELGRYIVGEAGVYVTRVVDRKVSRGAVFLVVDGGMHHQMAASGNFGQVIRRNYPIAVGEHMDVEDLEQVQVVGCLCTPLDLLGDKVLLPRADVGDLIVLFQAGAYGLTASPTAFLSHPNPKEVLV